MFRKSYNNSNCKTIFILVFTIILVTNSIFQQQQCLVKGSVPIDWSNLTSEQLGNIAFEEFVSVSAENISSIPINACTGFKAQQIASIANNACAGFTSDCFKNIPSDSFSGFNSTCISLLNSDVTATLTSSQASKLTSSACNGFTKTQFSKFNSTLNTCNGFSKECLSNIQPYTLSGISETNCFFSVDAIPGLTKDHIYNIDRANFAKWTRAMMAAISDNGCQGIRSGQMNDLIATTNNACGGFTPSCIANIPIDSMSSLNPGCINSINFTAVSAAQFAVIPSVAFPYIYTNTIRTLKGSICSGFTASQLGQLILTQCTNIQKECSQYIPKSAFSSIATNCLLSNDAISVLSKDQISYVPRSNFAKWTKDMMASLHYEACAGINVGQLNDLYNSAGDACAGFSSLCISNIPVESFSGLNPGCVNNLNLTAVSASQLAVIPSVTFPSVTEQTISKLKGQTCSGITSSQISQLTSQCKGFTKECISYIPSDRFSNININSCFFSTDGISGLTKDQIYNIDRANFAKWTSSMMASISDNGCQGIRSGQMNDLAGDAGNACTGFTPSCIANIPVNSLSSLNPGCINNLNLTAVSAAQLAVFPSVSFPYVYASALKKLSGNTCSGITTSQMSQLTYQCNGFTKECLAYIPKEIFSSLTSTCIFSAEAIPGLKKEQIANINRSIFAKWTKDMMAGINSDACQGININQLNDLYGSAGDACAGFTSSCITNIPVNSFAGLNPGCINNMNLTAVSSNQFAVIPSVAFPSVTEQAIGKLKGQTCSGITSSQISQLTSQCKGFNKECVSYIPPDRFSNININSCFLSTDGISGLTKDQIYNIDRANFAKWTSVMMAAISDNGCQGIRSGQMNDLYGTAGDACAGFTPSCISNIPVNSLSSLNPGCINNLNLTAVSSSQFAVIPYNSLQYVTRGTLQKLRGNTCTGITGNQLGILTTQCADFTSDCLYYIPNESFNSITSTSTCFFSVNAIPGLRKEQITNINRSNFAKWTKDMMAAISSETCQGIRSGQMNDLYGSAGDACAGFTPSCIANIPVSSLSSLNPGCINNINLTAVSAAQFTVFPSVSFPYVYASALQKLRGNICSGFTKDQLSSISYQCNGLTADCIRNIPVHALERMSPNCLNVITEENVLGFTKDQLSSLSSFTLGGITANQLIKLYNNPDYTLADLVNATQIESVDSNVILTFKRRFENGFLIPNRIISSEEISSTLTWLQLAVSTKLSISKVMNSSNIINIAFNKTLQGLRSDHLTVLDNEIFKYTNIYQLDNLLIDTFNEINSQQLSNIPLIGFITKDKALYNTFNGVNPNAIPGINQTQLIAIIQNIPSNQWTCEQFRNLTAQQTQWFKDEAINVYDSINQRCIPKPLPSPSPIPKPSTSSSYKPQPSNSNNPTPKPSTSSSYKPQPSTSLKPGSSPKPSSSSRPNPQPTVSNPKPHVSSSIKISPKPSLSTTKPITSKALSGNPPRDISKNPRVSEGSSLLRFSLWMLIISLIISLLL